MKKMYIISLWNLENLNTKLSLLKEMNENNKLWLIRKKKHVKLKCTN